MDDNFGCQIFRDANLDGTPNYNSQNLTFVRNGSVSDLRQFGINDAVSAIVLHPNQKLFIFADANYSGTSAVLEGKEIWTSNDLKQINLHDKISSFYLQDKEPFEIWKMKCCRSGQCSGCASYGCGPNNFTSDPYCLNYCAKNGCDSWKLEFCRTNPNHNLCGCIKDTDKAISERLKYPNITAPRSCWPNSDCQKTDLYDTLITEDIKNIRCPNVQSLITNMNNAVIIGSNISQNGGNSNMMYFWIFMIILILAIFGLLYFYINEEDIKIN